MLFLCAITGFISILPVFLCLPRMVLFLILGVKLEFSVSMEICNRMEPEDTTDTHLSGSRIPIGGIVCLTQVTTPNFQKHMKLSLKVIYVD